MKNLMQSLKMQFRVPIAIFFSLVFPIIMMIIMIISYGNFPIGHGLHFIDKYFLVSTSIGLLPLALISFPIWISESIESKVFERLQYLGVNVRKIVFSDLVSYLILAMLSILLNIVIARLFFNLSIPTLGYLLTFLIQIIYCVLVLFLLGLLLALIVANTRILMPLGMIVMFLAYMFIGVFIRFDELPKKIISVSNRLPVKYMTNDFFNIWNGNELWDINFIKLNSIWAIILIVFLVIIYYTKYTKFVRR